MEFILQDHYCYRVELLPHKSPWRWIEYCGRIAYKSHDKITNDSAMKFCERLSKLGHTSVFGHSNIVVWLRDKSEIERWAKFCFNYPHESAFHRWVHTDNGLYINGNIVAWTQTMKAAGKAELVFLEKTFEGLPLTYDMDSGYIINDHNNIPESLLRMTAIINTNRLITHELVRHRPVADYTQESTRYCKYQGQIRLCSRTDVFNDSQTVLEQCFKKYDELCQKYSREHARGLLPHMLSAQIAVTHDIGNDKYGWKYIYKLRSSKEAAPQIRQVMESVKYLAQETYNINIGGKDNAN